MRGKLIAKKHIWAVSQAIPAFPQKLTWGYSEHLPKSTPKTTQNSRLMSKSGPFFCRTAQNSRVTAKAGQPPPKPPRTPESQRIPGNRRPNHPKLQNSDNAIERLAVCARKNHGHHHETTRWEHGRHRNEAESHRPTRKHSGAQGKASSRVDEQATQPAPNPRKTKRGRHPLGVPASCQAA